MNAAAPAAGETMHTRAVTRPVLAGAASALAMAHLGVIAYLDALTSQNYEWIISGPAPFNGFGGGPFMLWFHVSFALAIIGLAATGSPFSRAAERCFLRRS